MVVAQVVVVAVVQVVVVAVVQVAAVAAVQVAVVAVALLVQDNARIHLHHQLVRVVVIIVVPHVLEDVKLLVPQHAQIAVIEDFVQGDAEVIVQGPVLGPV